MMMLSLFDLRKTSLALFLIILLAIEGLSAVSASAVSRFSINDFSKTMPAGVTLNDIWFYNADRNKTVPDIDLDWIAVIFRSSAIGADMLKPDASGDEFIKSMAERLLAQHGDLIDFYYDKNLADDSCFFRLRPDMTVDELPPLLAKINEHEAVSYAHPALKIQDRPFAFFNAFTLDWKTGVTEEEKSTILNQVPVSFDNEDQIYRVDVRQKPFFQILNLLAEDIHVLQAAPYLLEIHASIRGNLTVSIAGGNLGDQIPFMLRIEFSPRVSIDPSSLATINLRPENIQKELFEVTFDPYDYTKSVHASPISISGQMKFYAPGDYVIPTVEIKYHCPECSPPQDRSFQTKPVSVKISSIVPSTLRESNLIVPLQPPQMPVSMTSSRQAALNNLAISLVCLVLMIGGVIWCLLRRLSLKKEKERLHKEKREDLLADQLRALIAEAPGGDPWKFLSQSSVMFRDYLICRYHNSSAPTGGNSTVFWKTIGAHLPPEVGPKTKTLLEDIDRAAAHDISDDTILENIRQRMAQVLTLTTVKPSP
jgi:hypothetical protein